MELPEYITVDEVKRVCKALKISDWTALTEAKVQPEEAAVILAEINHEGMPITLERFCRGLEVELEHGVRFKDANVTNNHPVLTGRLCWLISRKLWTTMNALRLLNWRVIC